MQWTSDVSVNGQRYVDSPVDQVMQHSPATRRSRGKAIASFVLAVSAVAVGWVPFVFVVAACAAIVAFVFGILGLKSARRQGGHGRSFAVAGLVLSPVAIAVCVGGFFFTRALLREIREFEEPGPHELLAEQPCTLDEGRATFEGTIRNLDDHERDYRIEVTFANGDEVLTSDTLSVRDVGPGETAPWSSSVEIGESSVECSIAEVTGPLPFDFEPDE